MTTLEKIRYEHYQVDIIIAVAGGIYIYLKYLE